MSNNPQDPKPAITLKVESAQLDKLVETIRRSGKPQSLEALTRRYIELLKESAGIKR